MYQLEQTIKSIKLKTAAERLTNDFKSIQVKYLTDNSSRGNLLLQSILNSSVKIPPIKLPENIEKLCVELDRLGMAQKMRIQFRNS